VRLVCTEGVDPCPGKGAFGLFIGLVSIDAMPAEHRPWRLLATFCPWCIAIIRGKEEA